MWREYGPSGLWPMIGIPMILLLVTVIMHVMPRDVLNFFTAWLLVSFPVGMLLGHCTLSDE